MSLKWKGKKVIKGLSRASRVGINMTMAEAAKFAKDNHQGWIYRSGAAEGSIQVIEPAITVGNVSLGIWGSIGVDYFKYLEGRYLTLRVAAQVAYPNLISNIRKAFR